MLINILAEGPRRARCAPHKLLRALRAPLENRPDPVQTARMTHHAFTLSGAALQALATGALFWPDLRLLVVSDLHLGKSERLARRGGTLLPPYETRATLAKLDADIDATQARAVICLGDSFDDTAAADSLDEADRLWLARLMAGRDWTWVTGNHDPGPIDLGGTHRASSHQGAVTFRHIATSETPEVSGHYHPKARLAGRSRPCFLIDAARIIMPAYGTYTGGLWADDPALASLMKADAVAVLTGTTARAIPMPRSPRPGKRQIRPRSSSFSR